VTAQSGVLDVHVHGVVEHTWVDGVAQTLLEVVVFCGSVDLRWPCCFTSDCDAQLLYTDAAPVLYASRRV